MRPSIYEYEIIIRRVESPYLADLCYRVMCDSSEEGYLKPGERYWQRYCGDLFGHLFRVTVNTAEGEITSNEVRIPERSPDVAFEVLTEHDESTGLSLRLVPVPFVRPEGLPASPFTETGEENDQELLALFDRKKP